MALGPVLHIVGLLLGLVAVSMAAPALVDLIYGNPDWQVFAGSSLLVLFVAVSLFLSTRGAGSLRLNLRQAFLLTNLSWLSIAGAAAIPFAFSELSMSVADSFFEAMSGITTTGSTVIQGLDDAPPGILLWRAILQWLGGIGIIVMALAVLPILSVGGMQLFKTEAFDTPDKVLPRAAQLASGLGGMYLFLTATWAVMLWFAGMNGFDAVVHAMTTIATGGFSSRDASIGYYQSASIDWIITAGMIVGSLPFVYYLRFAQFETKSFLRDTQVRWFLAVVILSVAFMTIWVAVNVGLPPGEALRYAAFNLISVMTGTGYATTDFGAWGGFAVVVMFSLMFVGGCAGSTTCGIKIFRFQVLGATAAVQLGKLLRPHGVFIPYYNRKPIPEGVSAAVMGFFFLYIFSFILLSAALAALGLDFITAMSGAATAISNVGPGLGYLIGPAGNFDGLPDTAKWLLAFGMLLGRLELFTILVMMSPAFWRK